MNDLNDSVKIDFNQKQPCVMEVTVTIPSEAINAQMNSLAKEYAKYANVPGFRVGKAPASLVKRKYSDKIIEELDSQIQKVVLQKINEDLEEKMVTMPVLVGKEAQIKDDEDYSVLLSFNTEPVIELPEYKGLEIESAEVEFDESSIEAEIDRYREMFADYATIDGAAEEGDMLKVTYSSNLEEIEDAPESYKRYLKAENSWIWLNEPEMMPGVIKALMGVKAGDTKKISIEFGEDFVEPLLDGKSADFSFEIIEVQRRMPLTSDEELCEKLKVESLDVLKEQLLERQKLEAENKARVERSKAAINKIVEQVEIESFPPDMLARDKEFEFRRIADELVKSEDDVPAFKEKQEEHLKAAEDISKDNLRKYFVCSKIAEKEDITISQQEIDRNIQQISQMYGYKPEDLAKQMMQSGDIDKLHMDLLQAKVAAFIVDNAKKDEVEKKNTSKKADKKADKNEKDSE
jgi:trigger factor